MAILNSIRKRGVFLIIIIALALFSFILADVIRNGGFSSEKSLTTVATVNGEEMTRDDFMKKVEQSQRTLGPNGSTAQAMNMVWDRELRSVLQNQEYEKLGLTAQQDQVNASLQTGLASNATFQDVDGNYSPAKVQEYIADVQRNNPTAYQQWIDYENGLKDNILQTQYYNLIKAGMRSTLSEGEQQYRFENDKINIDYVFVPYTKIPDTDITVSDSEIGSYIKDNPSDFEVQPQVDIQYVSFSEKPSEEDMQAAKADVAALLNDREVYNSSSKTKEVEKGLKNTTNYAEFVNANSDIGYNDRVWFKSELPANIADTLFAMNEGDIYGPYQQDNTNNLTKVIEVTRLPDSVQSSHMLIRWKGTMRASDAITRSKEDAKKLADSLNALVKKSPSKFEDLAKQFSDDKSNSEKGGDLGYSGPGRMVPAFNDFIFDNKEGSVGVVETDFGYHVVKVGEQKNMQKAIKVATVSKEIEASEKTLNDVFAKASKFEVASQKGDFTEVAKSQELNLKPVNKISNMDASIPGIGNNRSIVNWAFEENSEVGDIKRFSTSDGYVIAQLTRKSPRGLMSVAEASAVVTPKLRNKKKAEKIKAGISGNDLNAIATSQNVTVQNATAITMAAPTLPGAGAEPKVVGAAFAKKAGESTGLIDGEKGVFKVKVTAVNPAPGLENYATYSNQLNSAATPTVNSKVFQALKNAADVEDNRANFF
ncbi:peptidylprolyl isomerase [Patiriisocius marinistellae]|uniref:Periplasmic chaperone PpiD n=1 Tax=Patiriisocius marinistellae TaxID=2494560 RepID=A0A5J4FSU3_9FLAO|nr:peptidylprolyl isomerase [Patiriisocius marinistellae]GEQ85357.1 peptidylprolyl isomerase [Patiriisocius marinistellae]